MFEAFKTITLQEVPRISGIFLMNENRNSGLSSLNNTIIFLICPYTYLIEKTKLNQRLKIKLLLNTIC